ncbi:hypothetical protein MIND_00483900 [Mycena indigotica]|uniref:Uncharacterized protein n=1 Tax=Mycena indigotica TaxID=2126181 RepID=A0A8H6W5V1_9AGAR|nr:uncharacterized protein MIND_00483900 [Mycena indigotica]KAF7306914.1 hypothetical protein MIND_00483900 [Mycena indigotica]
MAYTPYYNYAPQQQLYGPGPLSHPSSYHPIYAPNATPIYPPTAYSSTPHPAPTPFIPPSSFVEPIPEKPVKPESKNRPKHSHRAATTPLPLKSALKKPPGATPAPSAPIPLSESTGDRPRKHSKHRQEKATTRAPPPAAATTTIDPSDAAVSYHMFVTFKGDSELLLENTLDNARKDIEEVLRLWKHGLESSQYRASDWTIRFKNGPWNMAGPDVADAWGLVVSLFTLFARRGFSFVASTKTTTTQPRLIFQATTIDYKAHFFLAYMSRNGRRATLINPPAHIMSGFGAKLQACVDHVDVSYDSDLVISEIKREIGGTGVKPSFFLMKIMKIIMDFGYELKATVPMARGGPLGMGSRRELLVFKGSSGE